jgi:hypothetical protein
MRAYLSASRALLLHLQEMRGDPIRALVYKIELDMVRNEGSLEMCRYNDQSFNTSGVIVPDWSAVPFHLPSLLTFGDLMLTVTGCGFMALRCRHGSHTMLHKVSS